ncbi:antiterminator Q family protein [Pectobacteriaceae bacterium C52]|nr:antiterminator Q family protein [Pectobacteriaceae bacterium C52]WJY13624.1 antiterminator Q family protein [Pectobacteriaceae bacterium CE90]
MSAEELKLTRKQQQWLTPILEQFGAWVYSGRMDRRQISMIYQFMARVKPAELPARPICNDEDGELISYIFDEIYATSRTAFVLLFCRYVYDSSDRHLARVYRKIHMTGEATAIADNDSVNCLISHAGQMHLTTDIPSLSTCRRESAEMLNTAEYLVYLRLNEAIEERRKLKVQRRKIKQLTFEPVSQ